MIIIAAGTVFLAAQAFLLFCGFGIPPKYGDTFMGELKDKLHRLEKTPGKRIIFVGGSGTAFGYDGNLTEQAFPDYQAVNFGMYAGLGTRAVMELSQEYIRQGDLVILSPEQDPQTLSCYFNGTYMWQAADGDFGMLKGLERNSLEQLLGTFPGFALDKLGYAWRGSSPKTDRVYRRASFDSSGTIRDQVCPENIMPEGYDPQRIIAFDKELMQEEFLSYMNAYAEKLEKKGASVWYRFCPVNEAAVKEPEELTGYFGWLREELEFPVMGNPRNSLMEKEWFFDTNFHLNAAGKKANTIQTVRDIKAMLGDPSPVKLELPEKPGEIRQQTMKKTRLWTREDSDAFKNQEEIILPEEITGIASSAFADCRRLKRIVLKQKDPGACTPGPELLEGTDAVILVPADSLDQYRLNYSWAPYADRIQAGDF